MPIAASDLILYCSANMPEDDTSTSGGAIDLDTRPVFTQLAADDDLEAVSSDSGDTTQTITVVCRKTDGSIQTSTATTLTGLSAVQIAGLDAAVERVLKVTLSGDCAGTITLRRRPGGATVCTIPPGERGIHIVFYDSTSDPDYVTRRYEKLFWKNTHATLALTNATVQLSADPSSVIQTGVALAKDGTTSITDRLETNAESDSRPAGITFVDDAVDQNVPTGSLGAGEAIGIWVRLDLAAGNAPVRSTFTLRIAGATT